MEILIALILFTIGGLCYSAKNAIYFYRDKNVNPQDQELKNKYKRCEYFKDNIEKLASTVNVCMAFVNSFASVAVYLFVSSDVIPYITLYFTNIYILKIISVILSVFIALTVNVIIGRLVVVNICGLCGRKFLLVSSGIIYWASVVLSPLNGFLNVLSNVFIMIFTKGKLTKSSYLTKVEKEMLSVQGYINEYSKSKEEKELLNSVYEFSDIDVADIMLPKPKICSIQIDTPSEEVLKKVVESGFSRYPVYMESLDDTVGILYNKDLLSLLERKRPFKLKDVVRPAHFVPEKKKVSEALKDMQNRRINMLMVVNDFGSVVGLVTVEDAIEEIVGEVRDENEKEQNPVVKLADGSMLIDATITVRELKNDYGLSLDESEHYDSLAGFMISRIATIPKGGEFVEEKGYRYTIINMDRRRVSLVKVEKLKEDIVDD